MQKYSPIYKSVLNLKGKVMGPYQEWSNPPRTRSEFPVETTEQKVEILGTSACLTWLVVLLLGLTQCGSCANGYLHGRTIADLREQLRQQANEISQVRSHTVRSEANRQPDLSEPDYSADYPLKTSSSRRDDDELHYVNLQTRPVSGFARGHDAKLHEGLAVLYEHVQIGELKLDYDRTKRSYVVAPDQVRAGERVLWYTHVDEDGAPSFTVHYPDQAIEDHIHHQKEIRKAGLTPEAP
jgi:hypothetical protein